MIREILRYGIKGAFLTMLNVLGMIGMVEIVGLPPAVAAIVSTTVLILLGFVLMNRFVFPEAPSTASTSGSARRLASYYAVILSGKGVNYVLFLGLLAVGVWYPLAWLLGAAAVFLGTFTANRWVWSRVGLGA